MMGLVGFDLTRAGRGFHFMYYSLCCICLVCDFFVV